MLDKNNVKIKKGMIIKGILNKPVGYYDEEELEIIIKKGTVIEGEVIEEDNKLCVNIKSIMMPYVSMLKKDTREIIK